MSTLKDVALKAGVSTTTVSHVINDTRFVSDDKKERVLQAIKEMDFRPNFVARSLRSQRSKNIGLLVPFLLDDTSNLFFSKIAQGIECVMKKNGYNTFFSNTNENIEDEIKQITNFRSQMIDGLIIAPSADKHNYIDDISNSSFPIVFVDRRPNGCKRNCVLADGFKGVYEVVVYLLNQGHKKIGYISGQQTLTTGYERMQGYLSALKDHNIYIDNSLIKVGYSKFESGYELSKNLISERNDMTALIIGCNVMTMGSISYLHEKHTSIPDKLAVVGFDDYDWTRVTTPALSVIKQPAYEIGVKAAEILLKNINKPDTRYREYRLPTTFIKRGSC